MMPLALPVTLDIDFSGVVEPVGADVAAFKLGDAVLGAIPCLR
jgi:NADPH:quinone reductase-like Zn-dependent oxidoreductase